MAPRALPPLALALLLVAFPAGAETLDLANGDKLSGEILESTEEYLLLDHPVLGPVRVPKAHLEPAAPPESERPGLFGTGFMEGWTREVNLGMNGSEGNTVNFNMTGGFGFRRDGERHRWTWDGRYILKTEDRAQTDNNGRIQTRYDWLLPESRWFAFIQPTYDFDAFKSWKHRATVSGGPGYDIVKDEELDLRTLFGVSGQKDFRGEEESRFAGIWGLELEWRIATNHTLSASNQILPFIVNEPGEYRNLTKANWRIRLTEAPLLNLDLGVENEYESDAPPKDEKNDLKYFTTIGLEF